MRSLRHRLWDWSLSLPVKVIHAERDPVAGDMTLTPLFERYHVSTHTYLGEEVTLYLHHYLRSDPDRGVHDHPWNWAVALPLAGGYDEERFVGVGGGIISKRIIRRHPLIPYRLTGNDFHRVLVAPGKTSWSLFWTGRYAKGWGFLNEQPMALTSQTIDTPAEWVPAVDRPALKGRTPGRSQFVYTKVESSDSGKHRWWATAPLGSQIVRAAP